jgi:hypothetical protein
MPNKDPLAGQLEENYKLSNRRAFTNRSRPLRKGEFMMQAFPGRYKNEASAYQAYNQTVKGRRSGVRIRKHIFPDRTSILRGKRVPIGMTQEGLWKVIVHFNYIDQDGNVVEDQEISFNAESSEHTTLLAVPYLEEAMLPTAEEKLEEAARQSFDDAQITYIEVIPINTYQKQAVDLDELWI